MDQPQTQPSPQPDNNPLEDQIAKLERDLIEVMNAEDFFSQGSGQLIVQLFTTEITRLTRDITSDKYRKDHTGYNLALSDLTAYRNILKRLQLCGSKKRKEKIIEQLAGYKGEVNNG